MIQIHGHRGSRGTHPENILTSFKEAYEAGANFFELDTHLSKDDVPIVFHDEKVGPRVCIGQIERPIRELTAAELTQIDCGSVPQATFPEQKLCPGEKMASLETILTWVASTKPPFGVNIEIKMAAGDPALFARKVYQLVEQKKLLDRAIIQSFDFGPLVETRRLDKKVFISCLFDRAVDFVAEALKVGANSIGPYFELLTKEIVDKAHQANLKVIPWTVNQPKDWERLAAMGVDGIITDYPRKLLSHLRTK